MIVCVPAFAEGVYVTSQDEVVVEPTCARVQVVALNVPEAAGAALSVTVPVGNDFVPESLSETTVVQVEAWPNATEAGLQLTAVAVER